MAATFHYVDDRMALASCPGVFISVLRRPLDVGGATRLRTEARQFYLKHKGLHGSLVIIEPTAGGSPTPEVRDITTQLAKENKLLGAAITLEGTGFRPATVRTLIAGLYLVTKKEYPHKVFEQAQAAVAWLVPLLKQAGLAVNAGDILAAAEEARGQIGRASEK